MFVVIEQKEPHAGRMAFESVVQPATFTERCTLARRIRDELELPLPIFVDGMDDASRALFSDLPGPAFVLDRSGRIADKQAWVDPDALAVTLSRLLAEDPMPGEPAACTPATLEIVARRQLAAGANAAALAWFDHVASEVAAAPPDPALTARVAILKALLLARAPAARRDEALTAATAAVATAWPADAARRVAAYAELALAVADTPRAEGLWRQALEQLDAKAPAEARVWLRQQCDLAMKRDSAK